MADKQRSLKTRSWLRIVGLVLVAIVVDVAVHMPIPSANNLEGMTREPLPESAIIQQGLFLPAFLILTFVVYLALAAVFRLLEVRLPGGRVAAGLSYGILFGGLWLIGMLEASLILGTPVAHELTMGIADFIPIVVLGVLLGAFVASPRPTGEEARHVAAWAILPVAAAVLCGRYVAYLVLRIDSGLAVDPTGTFLWTLAIALWIGFMYWRLAPAIPASGATSRALGFSLVVFGSDWLLYHLYVPLVVAVDLADIVSRVTADVVASSIGALVAEWLISRAPSPTPSGAQG